MHGPSAQQAPAAGGLPPIACKLSALRPLSGLSLELLARLPLMEEHAPGQTLRAMAAGAARRSLVLATGWAARYRLLSDGRRQIISLLLPGDHLGITGGPAAQADLPLITLTKVQFLTGAPLKAALAEPGAAHRELAHAVEDADLLASGQMIDHMVRLGRQTGVERTAHLLSELQHRLGACGAARGDTFPMPLTQEMLADTLGLSIVHVNRTLQLLRRDRVLQLASGVARILKPTVFEGLADYTAPNVSEIRTG